MGRDKALLRIGDLNDDTNTSEAGTLLDFMQRKLEATGLFDEIIICRNKKAEGTEYKYLPDAYPDLGPISALYTLSVHYPNRRALVVPVDMPVLATALLEKLSHAEVNKSGVTYFRGYYFPLLIHFDETTALQLARRVKSNISDRSIAGLLRDIQSKELTAPGDLSQFANINTVEEWRALKF